MTQTKPELFTLDSTACPACGAEANELAVATAATQARIRCGQCGSEWTLVDPAYRSAPLQPRTVLANAAGVVTTTEENDWLLGAPSACSIDDPDCEACS